jgi:subtilisin family serine protease
MKSTEEVRSMEKRMVRFVTFSFILFVAINIFAVGTMMNDFKDTLGSSFVVQSITQDTTGRDPSSTIDALPVVDEAIAVPIPKNTQMAFIHYKPTSFCGDQVLNVLDSTEIMPGVKLSFDADIADVGGTTQSGDEGAVGENEKALGVVGIDIAQYTEGQVQRYLGKIKKSLGATCLDTSPSADVSIGTPLEGVQAASQPTDAILFADEEDDEGDEWLELDNEMQFHLSESMTLVNADDLWAAWNPSAGNEVTVCIIDTGVEISHEDIPLNNVILGYNPNYFNPVTGKYEKTKYYVKGSTNPKYSDPKYIDDISGHGTAMAGVLVSSQSPPEGTAPFIKSMGFNLNIKLMVAKISDDVLTSVDKKIVKAYKSNFYKAIRFCTGALGVKNNKKKADIILTGAGFAWVNDSKKTWDDGKTLFDAEWQVTQAKNPADKKQVGSGDNSLKTLYSKYNKYFHLNNDKKKEYILPLVVPAGNNTLAKTGQLGVSNALAALEGAFPPIIAVGATYDKDVVAGNEPILGDLIDSTPTCTDTSPVAKEVLCNSSCHPFVDFVAPGSAIYAPTTVISPSGAFSVAPRGTSMAAAHIAGTVATLLNAKPNLTLDQMKAAMEVGAQLSYTTFTAPASCYGKGFVDAKKSWDAAQQYT